MANSALNALLILGLLLVVLPAQVHGFGAGSMFPLEISLSLTC